MFNKTKKSLEVIAVNWHDMNSKEVELFTMLANKEALGLATEEDKNNKEILEILVLWS